LLVDYRLRFFLDLGGGQVLPHGRYGNRLLLCFLFFNGTSTLHVA
jgi:hypothetical protein